MKIKNRTIWLLILVVTYSAWAVTPASAHALLIRSNPAANAVLTQSPVQVELFYSEPVEEKLSAIKVYNTNGDEVDVGDVRVDPSDPTRMTVSLRSLTDGVYTVTWKAVSAIDGHQTTGTFPFAVGAGNATAVQAIQQSTSSSLPISALVSKFLMLVALALLTGSWLFTELVWKPTLKVTSDEIPPAISYPVIWNNLYHFGMIVVLISIGVGILAQAGQSIGTELALPWDLETGRMLIETHLGVIWLARFTLAILVVWLSRNRVVTWRYWGSFAANLALLLTVSLTSHAATEAAPLLPVLDDWVHLIGMTFWFGGLAHLFTGIRQFKQVEDRLRTKLTASLAVRFSVVALVFVALIGLTGLYSAYLRVGTWSALVTSIYGHALLIKQIFVAGLLALAATNLLIITPRLQRDRIQGTADTTLVTRFSRMIIWELILAGLLLASVSVLTYLPPAKIVIPTSDLKASTNVDDLKINVNITPGHIGQNTFTLQLTSNGQPVRSVGKALLRFTPSQANIPPSELELIAQGDGTFSAKGANLSLPSNWQVQAVIRRENKFDAFANFNFKLQAAGTPEQSGATPREAGGLLLLGGLLCGLLVLSPIGKPGLRFGVGSLPTLLMIGLGIFFVAHPVSASNEQANPIPPNTQSVEAGKAIYEVHCVPCHGESGKGDGPLGLTLNPHPADLTLHAIPGVHTDAQLFEWITNGFPGSAMPAWKTQISDTDRWNLVNFIRTLAPK